MSTVTAPNASQPYAVIVAKSARSLRSLNVPDIVELYKEHGAILMRGFDVELQAFKAFTSRFCKASVMNESPDRLMLDETCNIQTVNIGTDPFPLHPELSRDPWRPDVCFFWCMRPPSRGGETIICDGSRIVRELPRSVFDAFRSRRLLYAQFAAPEHCEFWLGDANPPDSLLQAPPESCPYRFFRVDDRIVRSFTRPALHRPMFSEHLAFANFLLFARYQLRITSFPVFENREIVPDDLVAAVKETSDRLTAPIEWQEGDILMLDNSRFMHGRNRITNPDERRIVAYFGYLRFAQPDADEPANAPWRNPGFRAPVLRRAP